MKFFWDGWKDQQQQQAEESGYSNLSDDELLDTFKSETWNDLDDDSRIAVFQEMENRSAAEQGREAAQIVSLNEPGLHGGYNGVSNQIRIDVTNDSSYESLDTYMHESNHAYQTYCIESGSGAYDNHTRSMMQAEMARDERGCLYNYKTDSIGYDMQCNELDSNNRAASFMLSQEERYSSDSEYRTYIASRADHYSEVSSHLDQYREQRTNMQSDQAYTAYVRGDISESQYALLNQDLHSADGQFHDAPAEECANLNESIKALNQSYQNEQNLAAQNDYLGNTATPAEETTDPAQSYGICDMGQSPSASQSQSAGQSADQSNGME